MSVQMSVHIGEADISISTRQCLWQVESLNEAVRALQATQRAAEVRDGENKGHNTQLRKDIEACV